MIPKSFIAILLLALDIYCNGGNTIYRIYVWSCTVIGAFVSSWLSTSLEASSAMLKSTVKCITLLAISFLIGKSFIFLVFLPAAIIAWWSPRNRRNSMAYLRTPASTHDDASVSLISAFESSTVERSTETRAEHTLGDRVLNSSTTASTHDQVAGTITPVTPRNVHENLESHHTSPSIPAAVRDPTASHPSLATLRNISEHRHADSIPPITPQSFAHESNFEGRRAGTMSLNKPARIPDHAVCVSAPPAPGRLNRTNTTLPSTQVFNHHDRTAIPDINQGTKPILDDASKGSDRLSMQCNATTKAQTRCKRLTTTGQYCTQHNQLLQSTIKSE